jgi:hypothetical protein
VRRLDIGGGRVWAWFGHLDPRQGRWVEMPARYSAAVTEGDVLHDGAIRRLTDAEVERAEEFAAAGR